MAAGLNVFVNIGAKVGAGFNSSVRQVERRFDGLSRHVKLRAAEMRAHMRGMQNSMSRFGTHVSLPAMAIVGIGGRAAYEYQKIGNAVQAVGLITDEQRGKLESYAKALNKEFPYGASQILKASSELAKAGFNFDQMMGTLRGTLNLSLAGDIETGQSADIATNILTGMGMDISTTAAAEKSLTRVVDTIAYAANKSNTDVEKLGQTFKYVAPFARATGMSLDQVSASAMIMANNGIKASEAGVALRSGLVRLVKPTSKMLAALARLNINLNDFVTASRDINADQIVASLQVDGVDASPMAKGIQKLLDDAALQADPGKMVAAITDQIAMGLGSDSIIDRSSLADSVGMALTTAGSKVDLHGFFAELRKRGAGAGDLANIFDQRQVVRLMTQMFGGDMDALSESVARNAAGSAEKMARMRQKGIVGAWARLTASIENLFIAMGESGLMDGATNMFNAIATALESIGKANPAFLKFVGGAILFAAVVGPLGWAISGLAAGASVLSGGARILGSAVTWLAGRFLPLRTVMVFVRYGLLAAVGASLPLVAAFAAIAAAIGWIIAKWDGIKAFFSGFAEGFMEAFGPAIPAIQNSIGMIKSALAPLQPLFSAIRTAFEWVFGPPAVDSWASAGKSIGRIVGTIATGLAKLVEIILKVQQGMASIGSWAYGKLFGGGPKAAAPPGRAHGGSVSAGRMYEWHERGREFFVPGRSGTVIDAATVAAINRGARGGGGSVTATFNIYDAHNPQAVATAVRGELNRLAGQQSALLSD